MFFFSCHIPYKLALMESWWIDRNICNCEATPLHDIIRYFYNWSFLMLGHEIKKIYYQEYFKINIYTKNNLWHISYAFYMIFYIYNIIFWWKMFNLSLFTVYEYTAIYVFNENISSKRCRFKYENFSLWTRQVL